MSIRSEHCELELHGILGPDATRLTLLLLPAPPKAAPRNCECFKQSRREFAESQSIASVGPRARSFVRSFDRSIVGSFARSLDRTDGRANERTNERASAQPGGQPAVGKPISNRGSIYDLPTYKIHARDDGRVSLALCRQGVSSVPTEKSSMRGAARRGVSRTIYGLCDSSNLLTWPSVRPLVCLLVCLHAG